MEKDSKIFVTGHNGLVGSNLVKELEYQGYTNILTVNRSLDLRDSINVLDFLDAYEPEYVFNCAGKVGGINANNTQSAQFIRDNILMQTNIIDACHQFKVKKLLFLGSSCIYPKNCPQPIKEEYLLTSPLEETNIGYAIAKISGIVMCRMYNKQYGDNFISVMPTNLYGPGDNFHLTDSHVLPALIRKFHEAKVNKKESVEFWGTGAPKREFLYVGDLAKALIFLMNEYEDAKEHINVGVGTDITIKNLVELVQQVVGYKGEIKWNSEYPDGTPQKLLDVSKINSIGWKAETSLLYGLVLTYNWFLENYETARK